jgi:hypothetical protein
MPPTPATPKAQKGLIPWAKTHQGEAMALGAGGLVGGVLLLKKLHPSTPATATPAVPPCTCTTGPCDPTTGYCASVAPVAAGSIPQGQSQMRQSRNQPKTATSTVAPYVAPTGMVIQGSGYWLPNSTAPVLGSDGHTYQWVGNPADRNAGQAAGQAIYIQIEPGVFVVTPNAPAGLVPGTPQFYRIS